MAEELIRYPSTRGPIDPGVVGSTVLYSQTVLSGPRAVGDAGVFKFRIDYAGTKIEPGWIYGVNHRVLPDFYFTLDYIDYRDNPPTRRIYMNGELYNPAQGSPSSYTYEFEVATGWKHIELNTVSYGKTYDPLPWWTLEGTTVLAYNGSRLLIEPVGGIRATNNDARKVGALSVRVTVAGGDTRYNVDFLNGLGNPVIDTQVYYTDDILNEEVTQGQSLIQGFDDNRIQKVRFRPFDSRRTGSATGTIQFGNIPVIVDPGQPISPTGTAVLTGTAKTSVRAFQSGMGQRFTRQGGVSSLG